MDIFINIHLKFYLINGTGNACAWQSKPKLWPIIRLYDDILESVEKVGAFAPTGSILKLIENDS